MTPAAPPTLIRASAGAGKTYQLSNRFLGLLAAGSPAPSILATTFTRKAAGEILGRVLTRLARAALDPADCARLRADLDDAALTPDRAGALLGAVVRDLHRLRVCTLDRFFGELAGAFGPELGLPPGWTMAEEEDTARLRVEAIDLALRDEDLPELVALMRVLGGGALSRQVVGTFDEIVKELHAVFAEAPAEAWRAPDLGCDLDEAAIAAAIAALEADATAHKSFAKARAAAVALARARDWEGALASALLQKAARSETYYTKRLDPPAEDAAARLFRHAQAALVRELGARTAGARHLLEGFDRHFGALQVARGLLRFEDVTRGVAGGGLAGLVPRVPYRLDGAVGHLLLDEFQDTSQPQWRALRPFADAVTGDGAGGSLLVVGDAKQAIYGWRGGVAEIFDAVASELPGVRERRLDRSFRSSPVVIDVVNRLFDGLAGNPALADFQATAASWSRAFEAHTTARGAWAGYVRLVEAPVADDAASTEDAVLDYAADEIARLAAEAPGRSVGVLVRRNDVVASLVDRLGARDVPASGEGGAPLTDSPAVRAVLALLRVADHPGDTIARFHVAQSPLGELLGYGAHEDDGAARRLSHRLRAALLADGYGATLYGWASQLAPRCDARDLRRLLQLVGLGYRYGERATLRPSDFVAHVEGQRVLEVARAAVRVMTYHQAKGLEFDVVVLPELDAKVLAHQPSVLVERASPLAPITRVSLPGSAALREGTPLEPMYRAAQEAAVREALSVLYVAVTRAVHALHLVVAPPGKGAARPLTFAAVLRGALAGDAPTVDAAALFEHGDPRWFDAPGRPAPEAPAEPPGPAEVLTMRASARPRRKERPSPSALEGGGAHTLGEALASTRRGALDRGTLIHRFFELVEWLEDGEPARSQLEAEARAAGFAAADAAECVSAFEQMLRDPVVRSALSRGGYAVTAAQSLQARRELPFRVREGDGTIDGSIDRLVLWREGARAVRAEVIDYKTDAVADDAALAQRVGFYRPQLEAYRRAAATLLGIAPERVGARLLFVGAGISVAV